MEGGREETRKEVRIYSSNVVSNGTAGAWGAEKSGGRSSAGRQGAQERVGGYLVPAFGPAFHASLGLAGLVSAAAAPTAAAAAAAERVAQRLPCGRGE